VRPFCCQFKSLPLACPFASSRLRVSPFLRTEQCSGWKARATELRLCEPATGVLGCASFLLPVHVHSPCVSLRVFASSREPISPYTTDLGLESPSYLHSRSIVVHSASDGVSPLVTALTSVLWLQPQRRAAPSPSGETELSRYPRHATAADGDSDLPLPHTRDATTLLYSTAYDDN
jgi:hypothetical protein